MSGHVVNQGEEDWLDLVLAVNYTVRLFRTDVIAGLDSTQINALTEANFTEANFTGYSAVALTGGSWTTTAANPSTGTYAMQTFTRSSDGAPQTIYGYYITKTSGGRLQAFEYLNTPVVIEFGGEYIQVTPRITLADTVDA